MLVWSSEGEDVWRRVRVLSFWWGTIKCSSEHEQLIQACNWRLTKGYNHCPVVTGSNFVTCLHSFCIALWQLQLKCKVYSIKATLSRIKKARTMSGWVGRKEKVRFSHLLLVLALISVFLVSHSETYYTQLTCDIFLMPPSSTCLSIPVWQLLYQGA